MFERHDITPKELELKRLEVVEKEGKPLTADGADVVCRRPKELEERRLLRPQELSREALEQSVDHEQSCVYSQPKESKQPRRRKRSR